jgi:glycosyltransferase involved in cell wall biosynthesis
MWRAARRADAVHAPIPGDVGTIGILIAELQRKPIFVRHCGNWAVQATTAERIWHWYMERFAGGRRVMLATGGGTNPPSQNPSVQWIFSSSLTDADLHRLDRPRSGPSAPLRLITVGRQEPYKRTDHVIAAVPELVGRGVDCHLDVVGDGSELERLRSLVHQADLDRRVTFHGAVEWAAVLDLLSAADVFVFPTKGEGFPKAVGEALAAGLPVVTTPVSVLPLLVEGAGRLVDDVDPATLADAVEAVITPENYPGLSAQARTAGRAFTLDGWGACLDEILTAAWGELRTD